MNSWLEEGLEELGLTMAEYKKLKGEKKAAIDECLKEMGHL